MAKGDGDGRERIEETVRRILAEGGASEKLAELLADNFKYREKLRTATTRIEELEKRPELEEGGAVLSKDEAAELAAFRVLGKPEEVKEKLEQGTTATEKLEAREEGDKLAKAAKLHGLNGPLLERLAGPDGLTVAEFRSEKDDEGEDVEVAYVVGAGDDAKPERLTEYVKREWGELGDALAAEEGTKEGEPAGTKWPEQSVERKRSAAGELTTEELAKEKLKSGRYAAL